LNVYEKNSNIEEARTVKQKLPVASFVGEWCVDGYRTACRWVVKQSRREATVSCHPDHVEAKFALLRLFLCKKSSAPKTRTIANAMVLVFYSSFILSTFTLGINFSANLDLPLFLT